HITWFATRKYLIEKQAGQNLNASKTSGMDSSNLGEVYDKVFNHLDMLHAPLEGKVMIITTTKSLLLLQETPGDLTTGDHLSPKVKMFLIPVIESTTTASQNNKAIFNSVKALDTIDDARCCGVSVHINLILDSSTVRVSLKKKILNLVAHSSHYKEPTELDIQEMVNILVSEEAYDKVFNHLDMLHAPLEGKVLILTTAKSFLLLLVVVAWHGTKIDDFTVLKKYQQVQRKTPTIVNYIYHLLDSSGTTIIPAIPTISTISTISTVSIVHVVSHLGDNMMKNGLQLMCDDSSNVKVLVVVVRTAL
ncbi:hypothetical protein Tco_1223174, partial [Tanacetum coccineum]